MDITVQWVRTSWTKQSRGGEAAARRNAVPIGFSLPRVPSGLAHFVQMSEHDGFEPRSGEKDLRGWSYWLDTFNIAYGPVDRDVFLTEPTVIVDECGPVR
ncbi:hypothetical protein AB0I00_32405 [Streptomyces sp. NPDC050803]|uniref:hypothetical protein n=1 Tax=unclassified Streptomyces TaxID=2593676 RepID=UPI00343297E6